MAGKSTDAAVSAVVLPKGRDASGERRTAKYTPEKLTNQTVRAYAAPGIFGGTQIGRRPASASIRGRQDLPAGLSDRRPQWRIAVGHFPLWSVDAARERAKELRREIDRGNDPPEQKRLKFKT